MNKTTYANFHGVVHVFLGGGWEFSHTTGLHATNLILS